jgi:hypothetical protein
MVNRLQVLVCLLLVALPLYQSRPTVGVIRWDAWNLVNGNYDAITYWVHKVMNPEAWHFRLPFYAQVLSPTNVSFNGDIQSLMDTEITYAKHAGLDYWAFDTYCTYGPNCQTNNSYCQQYYKQTSYTYCPQAPAYGLDLYLKSPYRNQINFTLLLLGSPACDPSKASYYVSMMKEKGYHTVLNGRPLVYLFQFDNQEADACGGWATSKQAFNNIRTLAQKAGLRNPYMVLMDFDIGTVKSHAEQLGFDAISSYALPGGTTTGSPFSDQVSYAQSWWSSAVQSGAKVVPITPTGWDPRPRAQTPPPYVSEGPQHYIQPTPTELQNLFIEAIDFTCKNAAATEAQTIIVYAWNESSENGSALIPSLGNSTLYVDALSQVLPRNCQ